MNCTIKTRRPWPTARNAVPSAQVVLPLPGPVYTMSSPFSSGMKVSELLLFQLQSPYEFPGDAMDAVLRGCRHGGFCFGVRVCEHDPQAGPVNFIVTRANRPGQLNQLQR